MKTHDCFSLCLALLLACWVSPTGASTNYSSTTDLRDNALPTSVATASHTQPSTTDREVGTDPWNLQGGRPHERPVVSSPRTFSPGWLEAKGMAEWWVSDAYVNLRIEDTPLWYLPARGKPFDFQLSYRQRGSYELPGDVFSAGPDWSLSCRAVMWLQGTNHVLHRGGAGVVVYESIGNNQARDPRSGAVSTAFYNNDVLIGFAVLFPDGAIHNFSWQRPEGYFYLTSAISPEGYPTSFSYDDFTENLLLGAVTDADGLVTELHYDHPVFASYVTSVTDPYGRSCTLEYDSNGSSPAYGRLTNIVDVSGLASGFTYDAATLWITNLATPYGNTGFRHGGVNLNDDPAEFSSGNVVNRFLEIREPNHTNHLYLYRRDCSGIMSGTCSSVPSPQGLPESFDNVDQNQRNSFYWSPLQYVALGSAFQASGDPADLTSTDYSIGRLRHWLKFSSEDTFGDVLSLERAPRPDSYDYEGQAYWFDYEGKKSTDKNVQGTNALPLYTALVLTNGETRFVRSPRNQRNLPTETIESYTKTDGSLGMRTNRFHYDNLLIDLKQHVGPDGCQVVSNYFNGSHQVLRSYNALNEETVFTYTANGLVSSIVHPSGLTNLFTYDASTQRLLVTADEPIHRTNTYTWASGLVATHTDPRGLTTTNYWDALQRLTGTSDISGTTSNVYHRLDLVGVKDRLGLWARQLFNGVRQVERQTNANGIITGYGYCAGGALTSVTNAVGLPQQEVTTYSYDLGGRRTVTELPDATTITHWYSPDGKLRVQDDEAAKSFFGYNHQGRLTRVTNDLSGIVQSTVYDLHDRPLWATDANGVSLTNSYDALHRLRTRTAPDGGVEAFGYSPRGLIAYTNQLGLTNFFAYDEAGRKTFETNANWEVIRYTNNPASDLLALVDGKGQVTRWNYDHFGRVTNKLDQTGAEILRYKYDPSHRLTNRWSAAKGETKYEYDSVGNLTTVDYAVSPDIGLAYDPLDRLTNMVDAVGTTKFTWQAGGLLITEDGPWADDTVTNTYTKRLRTHLGLAQPTGYWSNAFSYDAAARLTTITSPAGAFGYSYASDASRLTRKITLPNTSYRTNIYDTVARLTGTWLKKNDHTILDAATYAYNAAHQRTTFVNAASTTVGYTYDRIGQLQTADSSDNGEDRGYTYDPAWNLHYRTNAGTLQNFYVDGKNQLTNSTPGGYSTFDGNGNTLSLLSAPRYFGYDDENQLIAITNSPEGLQPKRTILTYDGKLRLRIRREYNWEPGGGEDESLSFGGLAEPNGVGDGGGWSLASETRYLYDGNRVIQERDTNNTPTVSYTRGLDLSSTLEGAGGIGGLLARSHGYSSGNWSTHNYYHADGGGNITYLVDASQALAASYLYDAYGNTLSSSGSLASANAYRFSSKEVHPGSGLYYYLYRWYDPNLQRWLNRDPVQEFGGLNLYVFVQNGPQNWCDPFGWIKGKVTSPRGRETFPDRSVSNAATNAPIQIKIPKIVEELKEIKDRFEHPTIRIGEHIRIRFDQEYVPTWDNPISIENYRFKGFTVKTTWPLGGDQPVNPKRKGPTLEIPKNLPLPKLPGELP